MRTLRRKNSGIIACARYLLKERILAKKKEQEHIKNFYRDGKKE